MGGARYAVRLGAAVVLASFALTPSALAASSSTSSPTQIDAGAISLTIGHYGPDVIRADQSLVVSGTVSTTALNDVLGLDLVIQITTDPIQDRSLLDSWGSGALDLETREVGRASVGGAAGVPAAGSVAVSAVASPEALALPQGDWGVYGVTVTLESGSEALRQVRTFATWLDTEPTVTPLSVVVLASGSTERVDALVATGASSGVTFAVDPTFLSPETATLITASNAFLLPAGNVDVASLARGGGSDVLDRALEEAREEAPAALASLPWIAPATDLDTVTVDLAASRGATAVISVPAFSVEPPDVAGDQEGVAMGIAVREAAADGDPLLLTPDPGLSLALSTGPAGSATAPARVVAETALLAEGNTAGNPVIALAGPSWSVEASHQSATLAALLSSPWTRPIPLADAIALDQPASITLPESVPSSTDIPAATVTEAGSALRGILALAAATDEPATFSLTLQDALIRSLSFDRRSDPEARDAAIATALDDIGEVRAGVSLPGSSSLTLISASGNVPVNVRNDLDVAVTVTVVLESRSPILRVHERPEITVLPGEAQQVLIPVTAVSSGNVVVRISLNNHDGARLTPVTEVQMRIHAQWGDAFTIGIAGLALALLVAGVFRTARRGKADTRMGPSALPGDESRS